MIPREGQRWVVRRGKSKRKVLVVIEHIYRRQPRKWAKPRDEKVRWWHEIHYKTDGTWARHGERSATARSFLRFATYFKETT